MTATLEGDNWVVQIDCDWVQLANFRRWNWINVCLLNLEPEWDRSLGSVSLEAGLLGFRIRASYTYDTATPLMGVLRERLANLDATVCLTVAEYDALKADAAKWRNVPVESLGREHA